MTYYPPINSKGECTYVPVVSKNRDMLIGYLRGFETIKNYVSDISESLKVDLDLDRSSIMLDSLRFNDILENGRVESECNIEEIRDYFVDIVMNASNRIQSNTDENKVIPPLLEVECVCGYGYFSFESYDDIPHEDLLCPDCGNTIIHYTGEDDYKYTFKEGNPYVCDGKESTVQTL